MSIQTAEQYEMNEQYELAFAQYKKEFERRPSDLQVLERLGHLAMMLNKKDEAADYYAKILEKDMTNTLCYEQLMDIYADKDRYKYYIYRGNLHSVEQKYEQAINDFKKALANTDNETEIVMTRFTIANLYAQTGNINKAIDEYLKTLDYEETPQDVFLKLADLYIKEDIIPSAIDILERAKKRFDTTQINEQLAKLYLKNNEPQKAKDLTQDELFQIKCMMECNEDVFEKLCNLEDKYKNNAEFYALKAQYHYMKDEYDEALKCVEKYNELNRNSALVYQMRALIYENKKDDYNAHLNWGKYNLVRGNKDIAVNEFLNAYQLNDKDIELMNTLAILLEETGDKNHAIEFWEKISLEEPSNKKALEKLADFRESIGDIRMQCEYLEKIYELDKRNAMIVKKLAQIYEKLKNKPAAIEFYKKYISLAQNANDYTAIKNKITKLENVNMEEDERLLDKIMRFFNK